jgi:hypothetical protein
MENKSMRRSNTLSLEEIASDWLRLRIHAVNNAAWAMEMQTRTNGTDKIKLSVGEELHFTSYSGNFLLPIYEIGFVHARALLEFIGLQAKNGKLVQVKQRRPSDIAIEHYSVNGHPLPKVSPAEICEFINMPVPVVEWALVGIIENANKLLAHVTTGEILAMAMHGQIWGAFEELPKVVKAFFYEKLDPCQENHLDFVSWERVD